MKTPKRKSKEQVLCYRFTDGEKLRRIEAALRGLGIPCRVLPDESHIEKVGYLLGRGGFFKSSAEDAAPWEGIEEVMLIDGIKGKRLDSVLSALKSAGASVPYKAVITPYNTLWTLRRLCETMEKEHGYMAEMTKGAKDDDGETRPAI